MQNANLLGNAIHQQASHAVIAIVDGDGVASFVQLVRASKSCRAGTDDSDPLASAMRRGIRLHPAHLESLAVCQSRLRASKPTHLVNDCTPVRLTHFLPLLRRR